MEEDIEYSGSGQIEQDNYFIAIDRTSLTVQSAWYSFVLTLGLIGNLYIILTVWCRKDMSSTTNLFIVNLAISDLGILAISLPAAFINDYFPWPFDKLTCQIFVPLNEVFFLRVNIYFDYHNTGEGSSGMQTFQATYLPQGSQDYHCDSVDSFLSCCWFPFVVSNEDRRTQKLSQVHAPMARRRSKTPAYMFHRYAYNCTVVYNSWWICSHRGTHETPERTYPCQSELSKFRHVYLSKGHA